MTYNPYHLLQGENPPSPVTALLAATLPSWTDARNYGLPSGPQTLTNVQSAVAYNPITMGSHWQRFMNAFAIELELLDDVYVSNIYERFLDYPGYTHQSLDLVYTVPLTSNSTTISNISAFSTLPLLTTYNSSAIPTSDPSRVPSINLLPCSRLFDFYFGLSQNETFVLSNLTYKTNMRIGENSNGSYAIEWITVEGNTLPSSSYSIASDAQTITFVGLANNANIVIHYTTYDVYYILQETLPTLYFRINYPEIWITGTGQLPINLSNVSNLPTSTVGVTPSLHMIWNELDEIGLFLAKPRLSGETNAFYKVRLNDAVLYSSNSTLTGLRNAVATELALVNHISWGPTAVSDPINSPVLTSQNIAIGNGNVYADSVLINRLPLAYYSVVFTAGAGNSMNFNIPALNIGDSYTFTAQMMSTAAPVIPGLVPITITSNAPASSLPIYDKVDVTRPTVNFSSISSPWYSGSLNVWKNGIALVSGIDFIENTSTVFTLTNPALPGDEIQFGYTYDSSVTPIELEALPDIQTDLAPILQTQASYIPDPVASGTPVFPGWLGTPPGVDIAAIPQNSTWTLTFTVTNTGSLISAPYTSTLTIPPNITFDGKFLAMQPFNQNVNIRYIDGDQLWVKNLSDPQLNYMLYSSQGQATPLFKQFAAEIKNSSPLEWGDIRWDRSIWHTLNEHYDDFGFLPNILDPDYSSLELEKIYYVGSTQSINRALTKLNTFGTASFGSTTFGSPHSNSGLVNPNMAGSSIGQSNVTRYRAFESGIGDDNDLKLSIAFSDTVQDLLNTTSDAQQRSLIFTNSDPTRFVPEAADFNAWYASISPGTYYLNQEEFYYFSLPVYAETQSKFVLLNGAMTNSPVVAYLNDPSQGLLPMRRLEPIYDSNNQPSLYYQEIITAEGSNLNLSFSDIYQVQFISASDGNVYNVSNSSSSNVITIYPSSTADITISYTLNNSFACIDTTDGNGTYVLFDKSYAEGAVVIYEGSSGNHLTDLTLHPYYSPRKSGFVYLGSDYYVPTNLNVTVSPRTVPADGITSFTVNAQVQDAYGSAKAGLPVVISVVYREGTQTYNGTTDEYGFVSMPFKTSSRPQLTQVNAVLQLFDNQNNPLNSLLDQTYVEMYNGLT